MTIVIHCKHMLITDYRKRNTRFCHKYITECTDHVDIYCNYFHSIWYHFLSALYWLFSQYMIYNFLEVYQSAFLTINNTDYTIKNYMFICYWLFLPFLLLIFLTVYDEDYFESIRLKLYSQHIILYTCIHKYRLYDTW